MKDLYIIGNGFDLYHGLKTSYKDFKLYLKKTKEKYFLRKLEDYFSTKNLWNSFEESLGKINSYKYIKDIHIINKKNYNYEFDKNLLLSIKYYVNKWILWGKKNYKQNYLPINKDSLFISFNYTNTLEELYNIDRENIIYLHGKCTYINDIEKDYKNLVIGHDSKKVFSETTYIEDSLKEKSKNGSYKNDITNLNPMDEIEANMEKKTFYSILEKLNQLQTKMKKNHFINMDKKLRPIFDNINNIDKIIILGHSLGKVDHIYFKAIFGNISDKTKVFISYKNKSAKKSLEKQLKELNYNGNVIFFKLEDIYKLDI